MQYIRHNFFVNFNNAVKYQDNELMQDLLNDEIAKLCVFKKDEIAKILIGAGVNIPKRPKSKYLAKQIVKNIDNESLRKNLMKLIYANNQKSLHKIPAGQRLNQVEIKKYLQKQMHKEASELNKHLFLNFNSDNETSDNTGIDKDSIIDKVNGKIDLHSSNKNTIDNQIRPIDTKRLLYTIAGIWIFGFAITQLTIWAFKKYEAKKFAEGGDIESGEELPSETPNEAGNNIEQVGQVENFKAVQTNDKGDFGSNFPEQSGVGESQMQTQNFPEPDLDLRKHFNKQ